MFPDSLPLAASPSQSAAYDFALRLRRKEVFPLNSAADEEIALLAFQGLRIDLFRHRAFLDDRELYLTPTEFRLVECFLRQPSRVFSRAALIDAAVRTKGVVA